MNRLKYGLCLVNYNVQRFLSLFSYSGEGMRKSMIRSLLVLCTTVLFVVLLKGTSHSLTLEEAVSLAKESLPSFKAVEGQVKSSEALYKASFSPYLPTLDITSIHNRIFTSSEEFRGQTYDLTVRYTLFDWGNRRAKRNIARLNLDISEEDVRKNILDLELAVKSAFFTAQILKEAVEQRKIQLMDAEKDYEVAEGRYTYGIAKLSDLLQASVRLEQARVNLIKTEGNFKKGLSDLNSLIGKPLDSDHDFEAVSELECDVPDIGTLTVIALKRPEIRQAEDNIKIRENTQSLIRSTFFPTFSADISYLHSGGDIRGSLSREEKTATLLATWNIFELGKFHTYRAAEWEKNISVENLNEIRRRISLDVRKTFEDFMTSRNELKAARTQLKQAEHNYSQAFGEYKVGKADILSLIQAESILADSREQVLLAKLSVLLSKSYLERVVGISSLQSLSEQIRE